MPSHRALPCPHRAPRTAHGAPRTAHCALLVLLATLAWALPARAQNVSGIVVDAQDRRIVSASVTLTCASRTRRAATDAEGRFAITREPGAGCTLRVTADRFSPATAVLNPGADAPITVSLAVAPVVEAVDVRGSTLETAAPIGGVVVTREQMRAISDDPAQILRVANARAGPSTGAVIYVDGLPAPQLPAVSRMSNLVVAADPYSAEYSDPGLRRIEVTTIVPDRRWSIDFGAAPGAFERPGALGDRSRSRALRGRIAGPSPWAGGAFSFDADIDVRNGERAVVATTPSGVGLPGVGPGVELADATGARVANYRSSRRAVSVQWQQALTARGALRIEASRIFDEVSNAGVGGEVLPEAGAARDGGTTELRATANRDWGKISSRTQLLATTSTFTTRATSTAPGVQVQGAFTGGGMATSLSGVDQGQLFFKSSVGSSGGRRPWRAGLIVARASEQSRQVPNPLGSIALSSSDAWQAALEGGATATVFRVPDVSTQEVALLDAALFAESAIVQQPRLRLSAGARADWQSHDRARFSPRLSAVGRAAGWTLGAGAGWFTHTWQPGLFLGTRFADGPMPVVIMAQRVPLDRVMSGDVGGAPITMDVSAALTRARYVMTSQRAERSVGGVTVGVEHVWWVGSHLLGAERFDKTPSGGWTDWLESNRRLDSHELRVRLAVGGPETNASVTYGWLHSKDDTSGAWTFPARQGDLGAEWARSARVAPHNLDAVASLVLPGAVHATAIASFGADSPYDIVSGEDAEGNGLYTDRGGLARNSGVLPGSRVLSLYLHRRFNLGPLFGSRRNLPFDAGAQFDNLLAGRAWTMVGNVVGSPLFGRPEAAMPGRSLRIWVAVAR